MNTFLPRFHLFEWEDQTFFPSEIRNALTQYLYMVWTVGRFYRATLPVLSTVVHQTNRKNIYDLCSGGGGAWSHIWKDFSDCTRSFHKLKYYPNLPALSPQAQTNELSHSKETVDVVPRLFRQFDRHNAPRLSSLCSRGCSKDSTQCHSTRCAHRHLWNPTAIVVWCSIDAGSFSHLLVDHSIYEAFFRTTGLYIPRSNHPLLYRLGWDGFCS